MLDNPIALTGSKRSMSNINNVLDYLQRRTRERNITYNDIQASLDVVEEKLGISRAMMNGVHAVVDVNAQTFPRSYKYTPKSTIFHAVHNGRNWVILDIKRDKTHKETMRAKLNLPQAAKNAIIHKLESFDFII